MANEVLKPDAPQELFNKAKAWWESRAVWGIIIIIVPQLLKLVGVDSDTVIVENVNDIVQTINLNWNEASAIIGSIIALWGRVKARTKIKFFN